MEQHYQIVNLHNIIKSQEAKIHELRQELKIANEREELRYGQFSKNAQIQIDEKESMIAFLKEELVKAQSGKTEEINTERSRHERDREKIEAELMQARRKNIELEGRLKRNENENSMRLQELAEKTIRAEEQIKKYNDSKSALTLEVTQLNHFYKNSLFSIARRKETLLWVDKFTEYLESSELKEKKTLNDIHSFVTNEIGNLRTSLAGMVIEVGKSEQQSQKDKNSVIVELMGLLEQVKKECQQISQQNETFWSTIKSERNSEVNEEVRRLKTELESQREQHEKEKEELLRKTKQYESEKKTLILGFQELRSLTEHRENLFKKEIKSLKETIEELIASGEARDKEFEEEIKLMSSQIEHISCRYYDNIDFPIRKFNEKIGGELEDVKKELDSLQKNSVLSSSMKKFESVMQEYVGKIQEGGRTHFEVQSYMTHSNEIIQNILELIQETKEIRQNCSSSKSAAEDSEQVELELLNLREKVNKSQYELILNKKHLVKMQEHCASLEKKFGVKQNERDLSKRIMQLEAENQALRESYDSQQEARLENMETLRKKMRENEMSTESLSNYQHLLSSAVTRIQLSNDMIAEFLQEERKHFEDIRENMQLIQTLLIRPMESFEILVKEFTEMNRQGSGGEGASLATTGLRGSIFAGLSTERNVQFGHSLENTGRGQEKKQEHSFLTKNILSENEVSKYKELLNKKQENNLQTQRLLSELIKTLRESQKDSSSKSNLVKVLEETNKVQHDSYNSRASNSNKAADKRIRDLQAMRVKEKQEILARIEKVAENVEKLDKKMQKSASLKATLTKFESNLNARIDDIVDKMQVKLEKSQIIPLKEEVIKDLRSKLAEANLDSEGLRKELSVALTCHK